MKSVEIIDKHGRKAWVNKKNQYHKVDGPAVEGGSCSGSFPNTYRGYGT